MGLPLVDKAQLPIDRADFQAIPFNALGIVINHRDVDVLWQVHDFMDYTAFDDDEDFLWGGGCIGCFFGFGYCSCVHKAKEPDPNEGIRLVVGLVVGYRSMQWSS